MGGGSGAKTGFKGDDAENMCGTNLEPDPRYEACCSNIFRPGKVLRDIIVGFLVVLAIAVVIAVLFVVCFYLLPATEESALKSEESAFVGKPIEEEINLNVLPEVELTDDTRYDIRPDVVLAEIQKNEGLDHDKMHHEERHHVGPTPAFEAETEPVPEAEAEPEPETEPEPEPESANHDHMHKDDEMHHGEMHHDEMHHDMMHKEGDMIHTEMSHDGEMHMHDGMTHDHMHKEDEMHMGGDMTHEHMPHESEMDKEGTHMEDHMNHEHGVHGAEEVFEVVGGPAFESAPSDMPTERTIVSVSGASGPGAEVNFQSSESEISASSPTTFEERPVLPPIFETLGPRFNETEVIPTFEIVPEEDTEVPLIPIEEVDAPILFPEETIATEVVPADTCQPRRLEMCNDLPYALTSLPNWANDQNVKELEEVSLPFFRDVIVRSGCSPRARQYACGILEPSCRDDGTVVPPCRTFCRSVASTCQEFLISGFSLSEVFDCEKFPDSSDPNVCFDMTQEPCQGLEHRCGDGRCVAKRLVCDGVSDCLDQSDEATCSSSAQAAGDEVLVEDFDQVPNISTAQDVPPSSPGKLSPENFPVSPSAENSPVMVIAENFPVATSPDDSPVVAVPEDTQFEQDISNNPDILDRDYHFQTEEEYLPTTQDYSSNNPEIDEQESINSGTLVTVDELGLPIEKPNTVQNFDVSGFLVNEEEILPREEPIVNQEFDVTVPVADAEITLPREELSDIQDPNVSGPLVTEENTGFPREEPNVWADTFTDANPDEVIFTTENSPQSLADNFENIPEDESSLNVPVMACDEESFLCHDGSSCVALATVCDGLQQCQDGSDEFNCTNIGFSPASPPSTDRTAIDTQTFFPGTFEDIATTFDGQEDTATTTVMEEVTTEPFLEVEICPELSCLDGTCLSLSQLNDGVNDCADGTDEQNFDQFF